MALPGPAFITQLETGTSWGGKESELDKVANPEHIGRLVLFDTWVRNCDRYPANLTTRRPNRDNVFLSRMGAPRGRFLIKAIDHSHCLTCGGELNPQLSKIDNIRDEMIFGLFPEFRKYLVRSEVTRAVSDLAAIRRADVQRVVDSIPSAWQVNTQSRDALVNFLCDRAGFLAQNFVSLLWPQGEFEI